MSEAAVSPKQFLAGLVEKIEAKSESFAGINWVLAYDFSASNDGEWHIVIEDGAPSGPFEGEHPEAVITTIAPFPVFVEEESRPFNPMTAMWNTAKVRYHGDAMVAHRFHKMLA